MFDGMTGLESFYAVCAAVGGVLFIARTILMFLGGDHHDSGDAGDVGDSGDFHDSADAHDSGDVHDAHDIDAGQSPDVAFRALSLQGLSTFFLMFGLVGLAMLRQSKTGDGMSLMVALFSGFSAVWLIKRMFRIFSGFQSSGTLDMREAIGKECTIYLGIKSGGTGKVQVEVQGRLVTCDAVSDSDTEFTTGERAYVTRVVTGSTLAVEKIN